MGAARKNPEEPGRKRKTIPRRASRCTDLRWDAEGEHAFTVSAGGTRRRQEMASKQKATCTGTILKGDL